MECYRLAIVLSIYIMVLMAFLGATGAVEDFERIAPAPAMDSAGVALSAPAIVAAIVSLVAWLMKFPPHHAQPRAAVQSSNLSVIKYMPTPNVVTSICPETRASTQDHSKPLI
ncbi:hypothetical protein NE237_001429 [Protea cynaroides]|uniref:Uncharacterized protein n=1 Tax=Protea cynaroides TaxID=273540 RepID=A0A9Q0KT32_9MAGN|nr:hypothetical protein NE237_001429 [Protea cynaroides]